MHLQNNASGYSKTLLQRCYNDDIMKRIKCYQNYLLEIINDNIFEGYIDVFENGISHKQYDNRKSDFKKTLQNNMNIMETFFNTTSLQNNTENIVEIYYLELLRAFNDILEYYKYSN